MSEENSKIEIRNSSQKEISPPPLPPPLTGGNRNGGRIEILAYDLPDASLLERVEGVAGRCAVFVPERTLVVIGRGSHVELELNASAIAADGVPVLRRGTGGCAVVLTPEMVAVSFAVYAKEQGRSADYFHDFNAIIIRALESLGVTGLAHAGTSDIALQGRKIAGTALYRNRELVFYHAILNLAGTTELMERYLRRPPRMPDYRAGRSHAEFVTSLAAEGFAIDPAALRERVAAGFEVYLAGVPA